MDLPGWLTPDTVTVEAYAGTGVGGPAYAGPVSTRARVEPERRLIRDANGGKAYSTAAAWLPLAAVDELPVESRITHGGTAYTVMTATRHEFPGAPNHWEVALR